MNMMNQKRLAVVLCEVLLAGCLAGCGPGLEARDCGLAQTAAGEGAAAPTVLAMDSREAPEIGPEERFRSYEPFGLVYDTGKNALLFHGERVRWFEDYYPLDEDGAQAGIDFFDEDGTVDVYAVWDRSELARRADGSYDPSGVPTGVEAFSEEVFAARDIEALQNSAPVTAVAGGGEWSEEERKAMAESYAPFGVTYDAGEDQWYYNGEAVCYIRDVLSSNGKSLTGGGFHGVIRSLSSGKGSLSIETVRDYGRPNAEGYGTLTGVRVMEEPWFLESAA